MIVGRYSYLDTKASILENRPTEPPIVPCLGTDSDGGTAGWETQPLRRVTRLCIFLDCLVAMKCQQNLILNDKK